jgi:hypothetical protein
MAAPDIESISTEELRKKKRFASVVLVVLAVVLLANIVVGILTGRTDLIVVAVALVATGLPMFMGFKKINVELERRASS